MEEAVREDVSIVMLEETAPVVVVMMGVRC